MKIFQILSNIDRRVIYLLLSIAVITPMIIKIEMPIAPDQYAETAYNAISEKFHNFIDVNGNNKHDSYCLDSNSEEWNSNFLTKVTCNLSGHNWVAEDIGAGKKILLSFDFGPSTEPELGPMAFSIMKQVLLTDNEVHLVALFPTGLGMITKTVDKVKQDALIEKSNIDFDSKIVQLGYAPGGEAVIKGMLSDIPKIFPEVIGKVKNLCDYDFIVSFSAGSPGSKEWVQFAGDQSESQCDGKIIDVTTGVTAVQVTELLPYVNNGQLKGILAGLSGAASYESLVGDFGPASEKMTPQSFAHLLIVILIIIGNITYIFINRKEDK